MARYESQRKDDGPNINIVVAGNIAEPGTTTVASASQEVQIVQHRGRTTVRRKPDDKEVPHDREHSPRGPERG